MSSGIQITCVDSRPASQHSERLGVRVELGAKFIGPRLRRAPFTIKRGNLIEESKRLRVAAPR